VAVVAAVALQVALPDRLTLHPRWLLPGLELALLVVLIGANPVRLVRTHSALRLAGLALVAAMTVANVGSAGLLILDPPSR